MDFGKLLESYGLPGMIIFAMGVIIVRREILIASLYERIFKGLEDRRLEGIETQKELNNTLQAFSDSTKLLVDKIKIVRGDQ